MDEPLVVKLALIVLKIITSIFDVVTLPIYTLVQKPWNEWSKKKLIYSEKTFNDRPLSSGMHRAMSRHKGCFDDVTTIDQLIRRTVKKFGKKRCLGTRQIFSEESEKQTDGRCFKKYQMGSYKWLTFDEVNEEVDLIASGLRESGIRQGQNIVVFAETRQEWMLTALAALRCGFPIVTLYATLGEEGLIHGVNETEVTHIVTSQDLLPKVTKLLPKMPRLTHIIYMENSWSKMKPPVVSKVEFVPFSLLIENGRTSVKVSCEPPTPKSTAIIMYTSGSSGTPKGVIISQSNLLAAAKTFTTIMPEVSNRERYVAYLPLAHVMELSVELMFMAMGSEIGYSSPQTLTDKGTCVKVGQRGDVVILRPTALLAVPLVLDRVKKGIIEGARAKGMVSRILLEHCVKYKSFWQNAGYGTPFIDKFMLKKIRDVLGGRVHMMGCGSAPLCTETFDFLKTIFNVTFFRGYGLTETSAGGSLSEHTDNLNGVNVGPPSEGAHMKLLDWSEGGYTVNDYPNPRGEIVIGGDIVTEGYYKNEALTKETFYIEDDIRWCRTGDIGELLPNGTLKIVDRRKDLIKLQFGEYVSLGKVEAEFKTSPLIENICVYGNSHYSFLIAFVQPNEAALIGLADKLGYVGVPAQELCNKSDVIRLFLEQMIEHGKKSKLNKMEIPLRLKLCTEEWLPETGLVTAALKIRRKQIADYYKADIGRLYGAKSG